jgi:hypothetical protein
MECVVQGLIMKNAQWNKELYFTGKFTLQKLAKYYAKGTPTPGLLHKVLKSSICGPFLLSRVQENPEPASSVPVFAQQFPQLCPPILMSQYRAWYVIYAALHGSSFRAFQC